GVIHIGLSESDLDFVNHNTVAVGNNTKIVAVGDVTIKADNNFTLWTESHSDGGGLISSADATTDLHLNSDTHGNIGTNAIIVANSVDIEALLSSSNAHARAEATAGGLFGNTDADATVDGTTSADVTINGGGTQVDGIYGVDIKADLNNFNVDVSKHSLF